MKIRDHSGYPDTAETQAEAEYDAEVQAEAAQTITELRAEGLLAGAQDDDPLTPAEEAEFNRDLAAADSGHGVDRADPSRPRYPE